MVIPLNFAVVAIQKICPFAMAPISEFVGGRKRKTPRLLGVLLGYDFFCRNASMVSSITHSQTAVMVSPISLTC